MAIVLRVERCGRVETALIIRKVASSVLGEHFPFNGCFVASRNMASCAVPYNLPSYFELYSRGLCTEQCQHGFHREMRGTRFKMVLGNFVCPRLLKY